jgi:protein-disulfide isomerase/uncharacterized membrane protein
MGCDGGLRERPFGGYAIWMQKSGRPAVVLGTSVLGVAVSAYLTQLHLRHLATGAPSLCNFSQTLNCDVVNTSPWSELFGTPISHLGTLFYLGMAALSTVALLKPALQKRLHGYMLLGALFAVGYSLFLGAVSMQLGALCLFCASLYVVNLTQLGVLLGGGASALKRLFGGLFGDLGGLLRSRALIWLLIAVVAGLAATQKVRKAVLAAQERRKPQQPEVERQSETQRAALEGGSAPSIGPQNAPITLVEISDFECPFCQRAAETIAELHRQYPDQLRIVFHHFPLDTACNPLLKRQVHETACAAARAAVCADQMGRFFPYAERLFKEGTEAADLLAHARTLGLAEGPFTACLSSPRAAEIVAADIKLLASVGVTAVPVFFVNGRKIAGAQSIEVFRAIIDEELKARR